MQFIDVCLNLFIVIFETLDERDRIIEGRPWLLNNLLLALKPFDGLTFPLKMNF